MKFITGAFIIILLLLNNSSFAQASFESLKKEIATLSTDLKTEKEKTDYFKNALNLRKNSSELIQDSISIKITEISGNIADQTVRVKGLVTYLGSSKRNIQFSQQELVAPNGHIYEAFTAFQLNNPTKDIFIENVEPNIPYGFMVNFNGVEEKFPTISLMRLQIYGPWSTPDSYFNFKGLDINWK